MEAYLDRPREGSGRRPRPDDDPLRRVVLRLPRRHRGRQAARRHRHRRGRGAQGPGRRRQRPAGLRGLRGGLRHRPLAPRSRPPAPAGSGRCGPPPASRTRPTPTRCTSPTSSSPAPSTRCPRRRWRPSPTTARSRATPSRRVRGDAQRVMDSLEDVGIDFDDVLAVLEQRGRGEVREVLGRAGGDHHGPVGEGPEVTDPPTSARRGRLRTAWNTVSAASADELFGAATRRPGRRRRGAPGRRPDGGDLWGAAAEARVRERLAWVDLRHVARAGHRDRGLRAELHAGGLTRVVLCGMGGSSLAPEVDLRGGAASRSTCSTRSRPRLRARRPGRPATRSSSSPPSPAAPSRPTASGGRTRRPSATPASTRSSGSSWSPTRVAARRVRARRRLPRVPRRPDRRRPVLGADGLRSGAERAGRRRHRRAAGRGRGDPARAGATPRQPRPPARRAAGRRPTRPASTRSCSARRRERRIVGFGDWAEQLIAESTGKDGKGILPVVVDRPSAAGLLAEQRRRDPRQLRRRSRSSTKCRTKSGWGVSVDAPLGAQMLLWEYATAVAGRIIGINPFDQPDVE